MIQAFGGDNWINICLDRWVGKSASGRAKFREHGAWKVYAETFKNASVISATCDDYRAGAMEDSEQQQRDQGQGNKIDSDVRTHPYCTTYHSLHVVVSLLSPPIGFPSNSTHLLLFLFLR